MNQPASELPALKIRPIRQRDLAVVDRLLEKAEASDLDAQILADLAQSKTWFRVLSCLRWFPNPLQDQLNLYVAEQGQQLLGLIKVSPFNASRTTWEVDWLVVDPSPNSLELLTGAKGTGSQLLRYCFEHVLEARTWLARVEINRKQELARYRQTGFQPLAQITHWCLAPELLRALADQPLDLPNLQPVNNADAQLLYQLDTVSMPPLLRQVFDRYEQDFKTDLLSGLWAKLTQLREKVSVTRAYVFEPQRRAAIGYFCLTVSQDSDRPHEAQLTVHPAYTWLYPKLLGQMANLVQALPPKSLRLASTDYQSEREEYLEKLGADPVERSLLMSRSVWHKLRESRPLEALQFSEMLQGLQPARTPIPSRINFNAVTSSENDVSVPRNQREDGVTR